MELWSSAGQEQKNNPIKGALCSLGKDILIVEKDLIG